MNPVSTARIAGLAYVIIILAAPFSEFVVRGSSVVSNDAAATAANILAREPLWRLGAVSDFVTASCDTIVAIMLYALLKPLGRTTSLLAAVFQLVLVVISAVKILLHLLPLNLLLAGDTYLSHFTAAQLQDLAYLSLRLHDRAYDIMMFFFGLHCVLVGWLILKATFLPRLFGWLLLLAGLCYAIDTLVRVAAPEFASQLWPWTFLPGMVGETGLALWLLIRGVNPEKWRAQANAPGAVGQS